VRGALASFSLSLSPPVSFSSPLTHIQHTNTLAHPRYFRPPGRSLKALTRQGLSATIEQAFLSFEQQRALAQSAPVTLETPAGTRVPLRYASDTSIAFGEASPGKREEEEGGGEEGGGTSVAGGGRGPVLESKLQEWFGCCESPCVGESESACVVCVCVSGVGGEGEGSGWERVASGDEVGGGRGQESSARVETLLVCMRIRLTICRVSCIGPYRV
jgi:hypothetical protein